MSPTAGWVPHYVLRYRHPTDPAAWAGATIGANQPPAELEKAKARGLSRVRDYVRSKGWPDEPERYEWLDRTTPPTSPTCPTK